MAETTTLTEEQAQNEAVTQAARFGTNLTTETLQPAQDFDITPVTPSTEAAGLQGQLEAQADSFTKNLETRRDEVAQAREQSLSGLITALTETPGETELTAEAFSRPGGVDDIQKELDTINQQILEEQHGLRRQLEALEEQGGGLTSGLEIEKERVTRESLKKQADLSIIQMGIQGRFDSAKAIADRVIAVQMERKRNVIQALSINYEANRDLFNRADQRAFEAAQRDRERKLDQEEQRLRDIYGVATAYLQEGGNAATAQEIMQSGTLSEALSKTGNVIGATARLQRSKLVAEINKITNPPDTNILVGKDKFDAQLKLADVFDKRTGDYKKASTQIQNIRASYNKAVTDAAAGGSIVASSQGVLVAFQKLLDPTSVVRESEYARSAEGLSLLARIEGQAAKLKQGGAGVTATDLKEFADTAETFLRGYENTAIDEAQLIVDQSIPAGLDITQIIPGSVLDLMESRFIEALDTTAIGDQFTIGGKTYVKTAEDNFEEVL